jgi:hypothetical protein
VRLCLLLLSVCYLPVVAAVVRALLPVFDWDDASAAPSRKQHNYHVPCYYTGFPPRVSDAPRRVYEYIYVYIYVSELLLQYAPVRYALALCHKTSQAQSSVISAVHMYTYIYVYVYMCVCVCCLV